MEEFILMWMRNHPYFLALGIAPWNLDGSLGLQPCIAVQFLGIAPWNLDGSLGNSLSFTLLETKLLEQSRTKISSALGNFGPNPLAVSLHPTISTVRALITLSSRKTNLFRLFWRLDCKIEHLSDATYVGFVKPLLFSYGPDQLSPYF